MVAYFSDRLLALDHTFSFSACSLSRPSITIMAGPVICRLPCSHRLRQLALTPNRLPKSVCVSLSAIRRSFILTFNSVSWIMLYLSGLTVSITSVVHRCINVNSRWAGLADSERHILGSEVADDCTPLNFRHGAPVNRQNLASAQLTLDLSQLLATVLAGIGGFWCHSPIPSRASFLANSSDSRLLPVSVGTDLMYIDCLMASISTRESVMESSR